MEIVELFHLKVYSFSYILFIKGILAVAEQLTIP